MVLSRKMSKNVENGPLTFELAHFKNIFVPKPTVGPNFRQVKYFLVVDEKTDHILRFFIGITQNECLSIGKLPTLDQPFSKDFTNYPKSLKSQQVTSGKSTSANSLTSPLPERRAIVSEKVLLLFYHGVVQRQTPKSMGGKGGFGATRGGSTPRPFLPGD